MCLVLMGEGEGCMTAAAAAAECSESICVFVYMCAMVLIQICPLSIPFYHEFDLHSLLIVYLLYLYTRWHWYID